MKYLCAIFSLLFFIDQIAEAQSPRIYQAGELPADSRLNPPKDLNGFFPFYVPEKLEDWEKRAEELRLRVKVACGLWPMPEKSPLNPVIHGKITRPGVTIEKVYFESHPGLYVTGLLFKPENLTPGKKYPTVLCPHGHGGRLQDFGADGIYKEIVKGAERFPDSGRMPKLARCVTLARQGYIVLIHDMFGYADSQQLSYDFAHRYSKIRPELETTEHWGLFSTQAESRLISVFGLQAWNCIRALDFLESLPEVDPKKIAVTGNSGGGTQTIILCSIDSRPVANFPNGMVSSSMQGGCTCENASLLRIGTGNVELAALFAPKPQGMTAANDWTKEMLTPGKGFPELQKLYEMYGKKDNVMCKNFTTFDHNYNYPTRALMYSWFNKHLKMGLKDPIVEEDFAMITTEEQTVWDNAHPAPPAGLDFELKLAKWIAKTDAEIINKSPDKKEILTKGWQTLIGRKLPSASEINFAEGKLKYHPQPLGKTLDPTVVDNTHEEIPVIKIEPRTTHSFTVIWTTPTGKNGLYNEDGKLKEIVARLNIAGGLILAPDLFGQGEFCKNGEEDKLTTIVNNPREFAGYTHGYNHSLFAQRTHDILKLITYAKSLNDHPVYLLGEGFTGLYAAAAMAISGSHVDKAVLDNCDFRFTAVNSYRDPMFLPGAVKYGDVPGLLSLIDQSKIKQSSINPDALKWLMEK